LLKSILALAIAFSVSSFAPFGNSATDEFHTSYDKAVVQVQKELGQIYPLIINGKEICSENRFVVKSPANRNIKVAEFPKGTKDDTLNAIASAKNAFSKWSNTPYQERTKIFKDCADVFSKQKYRLAAIMSFENGKNRFEAMGDVDEAIDFMRYYSYQLEKNEGFCKTTTHPDMHEKTHTVMKPYGVWGIISPFNFPSAIAIGMTTGALLTGNTAILKPASDTPLSSFEFVKIIYSKIPAGAINFVTGSGSVIGKAIIEKVKVLSKKKMYAEVDKIHGNNKSSTCETEGKSLSVCVSLIVSVSIS